MDLGVSGVLKISINSFAFAMERSAFIHPQIARGWTRNCDHDALGTPNSLARRVERNKIREMRSDDGGRRRTTAV